MVLSTVTARTILASKMVESAARRAEFSVVIPCLNEVRTVGRCIAKAQESFRRMGLSAEIVVADNGSADGSQAVARESGARVVAVAQRGYGNALAAGIAAADGRYIIMGDGDDSYDFGNLESFVAALQSGTDLVVGNRFQGGVRPGAMPFLHKYLGNPALTLIGKWFFRIPVGDVYCGLRGFRRSAVQDLELRSQGMEFALEMIVKAKLHHLKIGEVPTTLSPDGRGRPPHLRTWRDGWRSLRFFLLFSPRWLFLYPGMLLTALGLATILWLLPAPRRAGTVTLDVHTMLYGAVAVLVGFPGDRLRDVRATYCGSGRPCSERPPARAPSLAVHPRAGTCIRSRADRRRLCWFGVRAWSVGAKVVRAPELPAYDAHRYPFGSRNRTRLPGNRLELLLRDHRLARRKVGAPFGDRPERATDGKRTASRTRSRGTRRS